MIHVSTKDLYKKKHVALWALLSFKAGLLNASGFLIAGSYVSHITGFGTQMGIAIGDDKIEVGALLLLIPTAFISGGLLTSLILDREHTPDKVPNYPLVQGLITALIALIVLLFATGVFHPHLPLADEDHSAILIGLLCLICGLKNALTSWATHGKIRTTHLTGLATDIGLHLPKIFKMEGVSSHHPEPRKVTYVRLVTLASFSLGSAIAALLIPMIGAGIFYIALFFSIIFLGVSIAHREQVLALSKTKGL